MEGTFRGSAEHGSIRMAASVSTIFKPHRVHGDPIAITPYFMNVKNWDSDKKNDSGRGLEFKAESSPSPL